jgi:hypothetical protein
MHPSLLQPATAFDGTRQLKAGPLHVVALAAKRALARKAAGPVLVFDDLTGKIVEIDPRGGDREVLERLAAGAPPEPLAAEPRGPGRPRLGVVAREVTLLPRHWAWLGSQPGGASVALRKLVDDARRTHAGRDARRRAQEAAYAFISVAAGDRPGFEEAARALFRNDAARFATLVEAWPRDLAAYARALAFPEDVAPVDP